ncbi:MAG: M20 family peptidase [Gemmatimonadaceae bacterium]|nr:M20 family peptidase [Gemmatimonadaceae bacterium]
MKRVLLAVLGVIVALFGVMATRAAMVPAPAAPALAGEVVTIDEAVAAARLSGAVKFATVSMTSGGPIDTAAFLAFHDFLATSFPRVHASLALEKVAGLSLLYTWPGTDPTLAPVVLMGHMDVVPVPEANLKEWTHGPFSGDVADGYVWGRGTMDDKVTVLAVLEAVEHMLGAGVKPARTVYLTFGHDEEVGGRFGARAIVDSLVRRGVKPAMVIDEGGVLTDGGLPGFDGTAAVIGIAEKGYMSLRISAKAEGGHSSMPTARTAVGALSRAIAALEANQFPSSLDGPTRGMLEAMTPYVPFSRKLVLANLWLTAPLVSGALASAPTSAAMLHTTTSPTMLIAGVKDNVLPPEATAIVNFRIKPGETQETVIARVKQVIADSMVTVVPTDSARTDPSPVSDVNSPAFRLIASTVRGMVPGKSVAVLPYLVTGGTDAKYWGDHSQNVYRFLAVPLAQGDIARVHGVNERMSVKGYATAVTFFAQLLSHLDQLK